MDGHSPLSSAASALPLLALGIGSFGIGTTEFAPMGLLPAIASDIDISIPAAGQLVTAYAIGVMLSAPVMTLLLSRFDRKAALMGLMAIFVLGNLISAVASGYWSLLAGRLITSLCQGAFFGIGAVVATSVVPPERHASAVATMFMGLSIANIGGVPASTWIGTHIGWRMAFAGAGAIGVVAIVAVALAVPSEEGGGSASPWSGLKALGRPHMLWTLVTTVAFAGGFFAVYTYVAPLLHTLAGADDAFVILVLVLIGVGLTVGNWLGGRLADWSIDKGAAIGLLALGLSSLALPVLATSGPGAVIGFFVWAVAAFSSVPALQVRAMQAATAAPGLAASFNIAAFNFGNAVGAAVGGATIGWGLGYGAVPIAGGLIVLAGLAILWWRRAPA
ncbi:DHA1 family inner membrane transport protein [Rhodobium orientis]|uniref:MFS transporter n=1 Tax=Rhodobium orientis TaxID=34017 RepID=A0A327JSA5_9HYPH|nr:MFS transporter [Rhodobium orientis]MBB4303525.1 DHA1 family inner membrane transport protein [Rhodobium orientis]MBK5950455.1 MFS transporter [Rhodobium orientis]RAI28323.1 MFS transporter [Rhodobium orientis]